jgi:hypothetical protein
MFGYSGGIPSFVPRTLVRKITGNSRTANDVYIKLYNQGTQVWSHARGDIRGGGVLYTADVSRTTYKYGTQSWWKLIADVNNWFDPSDSDWISTF